MNNKYLFEYFCNFPALSIWTMNYLIPLIKKKTSFYVIQTMKKFVAASKIQLLSQAILVFLSSSFEICDFLFFKDKVFIPVDEIN